MASNRAIVIGLAVIGAAAAATEYAVAHHYIELPDFLSDASTPEPASALEAETSATPTDE